MTDLVERLRSDNPEYWCREVREEAADEIERLRRECDAWKVCAEASEAEIERLRTELYIERLLSRLTVAPKDKA